MPTYDEDVVAWSSDQAKLIRAGRFDELDIEHIAEEIEDVGKSEQRELSSHMAILIGHLLKWKFQPERRGASWEKTTKAQRKELTYALDESPSLRVKLAEARWIDLVWTKGVALAVAESGLRLFSRRSASGRWPTRSSTPSGSPSRVHWGLARPQTSSCASDVSMAASGALSPIQVFVDAHGTMEHAEDNDPARGCGSSWAI